MGGNGRRPRVVSRYTGYGECARGPALGRAGVKGKLPIRLGRRFRHDQRWPGDLRRAQPRFRDLGKPGIERHPSLTVRISGNLQLAWAKYRQRRAGLRTGRAFRPGTAGHAIPAAASSIPRPEPVRHADERALRRLDVWIGHEGRDDVLDSGLQAGAAAAPNSMLGTIVFVRQLPIADSW